MTFSQSISYCFRHYADFDGRAARSEFWWFTLFCALVAIVITIPAIILLVVAVANSGSNTGIALVVASIVLFAILFAFYLATILPSLAVGARRLHDKGLSGWLQLIQLISPGIIALWVLWALEGDAGPNRYGSAPYSS